MNRQKLHAIYPQFVDIVPDQLEEGILYICERYGTVIHKCCCGCGEEVVTPLSPADWSLRTTGETVTLMPSIGNWSFSCRSHYLIIENQIVWANSMSEAQIKKVKDRDKADKIAYLSVIKGSSQKTENKAR